MEDVVKSGILATVDLALRKGEITGVKTRQWRGKKGVFTSRDQCKSGEMVERCWLA